jgi:two-component system, OmpR family, response regulator
LRVTEYVGMIDFANRLRTSRARLETSCCFVVELAMGRQRLVLIVDDQPDIREVVKGGLEEHGYRVLGAADGCAMRYALATEAVDLVVLDMVLPDESGLALAAVARRHGVPVLLISGSPDVLRRADELPGRCLAKPFRLSELAAAVDEMLAGRRPAAPKLASA